MGFAALEGKYKLVAGQEGMGGRGSLGIQIYMAGTMVPDLEYKRGANDEEDIRELRTALRKASEGIDKAFQRYAVKNDPKTAIEKQSNRDEILSAFGDALIYVEEVPNGYCSDYCCEHLPWFIVTTKMGRIKIGWRKRVISIDWSDTYIEMSAKDLFPLEDVTRFEKCIHAYGAEDAKKYVEVLFNSYGLKLGVS